MDCQIKKGRYNIYSEQPSSCRCVRAQPKGVTSLHPPLPSFSHSKVFNSRKSPAASLIRENSIQNACTSIKRSWTAQTPKTQKVRASTLPTISCSCKSFQFLGNFCTSATSVHTTNFWEDFLLHLLEIRTSPNRLSSQYEALGTKSRKVQNSTTTFG